MPKLIFTTPEFEEQSFELPEGKTRVGRAADNTLIIEDSCVSGHHCEILRYGREVIVRDDGSANGTWVDGYCLRGQTPIHHGQTIRFGSVQARFEMPPPTAEENNRDDTEVTAIYLHARASRELATPPKPRPTSPTIIKPRVQESLPI